MKKSVKSYLVCNRCNKNNWSKPNFKGCPRGSCEVKVAGDILITEKLVKNNGD